MLKEPKKATRADAEKFIEQAFTDRISWTAAHVLLTRVTEDPEYEKLDADLRGGIERFLEGHTKPI